MAKAPPETVLDPEIPIIDAHMHLWHHASGYRYFVEEYARDVAASGHNVEATVFIECRSMYRAEGAEHLRSLGETEFAAGMAAIADSHKYTRTRVAAAIVAFADLRQGAELSGLLDAHAEMANGRLRGIRNGAKWDADPDVRGPVGAAAPGLYLDSNLQKGVRQLETRGLIFEASVFHPQLSDVVQLAQAVPDTQVVLIHTGSPVGHGAYKGGEAQVRSAWSDSMKLLARCDNVAIKLGGLLMSLANFHFQDSPKPLASSDIAALWAPYIEECVELFGVNRCMFSSNFPVEKAGIGYGALWNAFKRITSSYSKDERAALFHGTARRIYRLGE